MRQEEVKLQWEEVSSASDDADGDDEDDVIWGHKENKQQQGGWEKA